MKRPEAEYFPLRQRTSPPGDSKAIVDLVEILTLEAFYLRQDKAVIPSLW